MGWCSGTEVFDSVCAEVLNYPLDQMTNQVKRQVIKALVAALENHDWDCQQDSAYWEHSIVQSVMKELNPNWDWDEVNG